MLIVEIFFCAIGDLLVAEVDTHFGVFCDIENINEIS